MSFQIPSWNFFEKIKGRKNRVAGGEGGGGDGAEDDYFKRLPDTDWVILSQGEEEPEDDYFKRLLDCRLILDHILDKISDAESLCKLSLVSKHMARLVFQAETVSVKITYRNFLGNADHSHAGSIWGKLKNWLSLPLVIILLLYLKPYSQFSNWNSDDEFVMLLRRAADYDFEIWSRKKFLGQFTSLRSLSVEYDFCYCRACSLNDNEKPIVKFKFGPNFGTMLMAGRAEFLDDDIDILGHENTNNKNDFRHEVGELRQLWRSIYYQIRIMPRAIQRLLEAVPRKRLRGLQNVVLADRKHGKIVLGQSDFDAVMKLNAGQRENFGLFGIKDFRARFAPVLKLPSSGCVMKSVILVIFKRHDSKDDVGELMVKEGFGAEDAGGGEEAYLKEAALAMLEKQVIGWGNDVFYCLESLESGMEFIAREWRRA